MRIIKKFYCTGCKKIEMSATPENPSKCPKCGEIRLLMDVWILKGDWVEEKKISSYQQDLMKYKGRSRHAPEGG